jgi:hypothetical protein
MVILRRGRGAGITTLANLGIAAPLPEPAATGKKRKQVKEGVGDRGKYAEKEVTKVLEGWNKLAAFAFERLPDARAARGALASQISDFLVWHKVNIPLEVKSTEHSTRRGSYLLSASAIEQLPRLKKVAMTGAAVPFVLVYFKATDRWRVAHIDFFGYGVPSWDMSDLPEFATAKLALESTGFFPTGR